MVQPAGAALWSRTLPAQTAMDCLIHRLGCLLARLSWQASSRRARMDSLAGSQDKLASAAKNAPQGLNPSLTETAWYAHAVTETNMAWEVASAINAPRVLIVLAAMMDMILSPEQATGEVNRFSTHAWMLTPCGS